MWRIAKVGGIAALRLFHITGSATQRVLQRKPVAAFLGGGVVLDDGAPSSGSQAARQVGKPSGVM